MPGMTESGRSSSGSPCWPWMAARGRANAATPPHIAIRAGSQEADTNRAGQWDKAIEAYVRLLAQDRQQPEPRAIGCKTASGDRHQARRHRDPVYRDKLLRCRSRRHSTCTSKS